MSLRQLPELPMVDRMRDIHAKSEDKFPAAIKPLWNAASAEAAPSDNAKSISVIGVIGIDFTAARMDAALRAIGEQDVVVQIHSPGGSFYDGNYIFNRLRQHTKKVTVKILGLAASAASLIAMAGDVIEVAKSAHMFVHNAEGLTFGNQYDYADTLNDLRTIDDAMVSVYGDRTGLASSEIVALMKKARIMSSKQALELGFADALVGERAHAAARMAHALAQAGFSRSEAKRLMGEYSEFKSGIPSAADDAMPSAGDSADVTAALAALEGIKASLSQI